MRGITISGDIDYDYRGEIKLIVINNTKFPFVLTAGVAIAHLIVTPYIAPEVQFSSGLQPTERGKNVFGSTTNSAKYVVNNEKGLIYTKVITENDKSACKY